MDEMPFFIQAQMGLDIVIRIGSRIPRTSIADFKIDDVIIRRIYELMPISRTSLESGTHAGRKLGRTSISDERRVALKNENKFILTAVSMA